MVEGGCRRLPRRTDAETANDGTPVRAAQVTRLDDSSIGGRDFQAVVDDEAARARDQAADARDQAANARDRVGQDDPGRDASVVEAFGRARDEAARDRAGARHDRSRAAQDRHHSKRARVSLERDRDATTAATAELTELLTRANENSEDMLLIGQAQGLLMASQNVSALQALLEVGVRAARDRTELGGAARSTINDART